MSGHSDGSGPGSLRAAIEAGLASGGAAATGSGLAGSGLAGSGLAGSGLTADVSRLMTAYRSGEVPAVPVLSSRRDAAAYAAYRMPATAAAAGAALAQVRAALPGWAPATLLDLGAGTGGSAWAVAAQVESVQAMTLLEQSAEAIAIGRVILGSAGSPALRAAQWQRWRLPAGAHETVRPLPVANLITAAYVLGELSAAQQAELVDLAAAAAPVVVLIEPGTPAGHRRVLAARTRLLAAGFTMAAPCPHQLGCPLDVPGDWCHFAARVQRSAVHRQAKGADLSYEDEKFSFVAAARGPLAAPAAARIVRRPQLRKNLVLLDLCAADGTSRRELVSKREQATYRQARRAAWGDPWDPAARPDDPGE